MSQITYERIQELEADVRRATAWADMRTEEVARLERRLMELGQTPQQISEALTTPLPTTLCGNEDHPSGPWHAADPIPFSWQYVRLLGRWRNRRRWGCACPRNAYGPGARGRAS